jgi:hypothetical protein
MVLSPVVDLPDQLDAELDLPGIRGSRSQQPRGCIPHAARIENVRVVRQYWDLEVRVIGQIEEFRAELDVERFRNVADTIVFDQGKVQVGKPRTGENISPRTAAQVDARREIECRIAVGCVEGLRRRNRQ